MRPEPKNPVVIRIRRETCLFRESTAALDETELETKTKSEESKSALACNIRPHREIRNRALVSLWPEKPSLQSPIKTRIKSNDSPKKAVKIAVLKTMTNADDEITTISRPLTCEECSRHKFHRSVELTFD